MTWLAMLFYNLGVLFGGWLGIRLFNRIENRKESERLAKWQRDYKQWKEAKQEGQ
jgi:hypothetical protein